MTINWPLLQLADDLISMDKNIQQQMQFSHSKQIQDKTKEDTIQMKTSDVHGPRRKI